MCKEASGMEQKKPCYGLELTDESREAKRKSLMRFFSHTHENFRLAHLNINLFF